RHHLGYALGQLGRWEEAVVEYRLVVEINPKSAVVRHQLGYGLMRLERWREAEVELRKAVELHPGSALVWQQLGDILLELGEKDEAVEVYQKAVDLGFDGVDGHYLLAKREEDRQKAEQTATDSLHKENELLLLQLTQAQEMLEEYYLKYQELSNINL
ncbi:tetratricopeptide repeat protein, partial [Okeania hirsuta]